MKTRSTPSRHAGSLALLSSKATDALGNCGDAALSGATTSVVMDLTRGVLHGKLDPSEVAENAVSAAVQNVAVEVVGEGLQQAVVQVLGKQALKQVAGRTASAVAKNVLRTNAVGQAASLVVSQAVDTFRLASGDIDGSEYGKRTVENAGDAAGSLGGSTLGGVIGTFLLPGPGTVAGVAIGGFLGSLGGGAVIRKITRR
jgi:hypothetical protein